jgi:hypothetical protein
MPRDRRHCCPCDRFATKNGHLARVAARSQARVEATCADRCCAPGAIARPRDGPELIITNRPSDRLGTLDTACMYLSRRLPATTVAAPTDQARVCLAASPPASATVLAFDGSKTRRPTAGREQDLSSRKPSSFGSCEHWRLTRATDLGEQLALAPCSFWGLVDFTGVPRCSPLFLVR